MFDFQKLGTYQKTKAFNQKITQIVWKNERCDVIIRHQLRRAALSIMLNIAEGSGRTSQADRRRFYIIARGSAWEVAAILDFMEQEQILEEAGRLSLIKECDEISRMLQTLINQLTK